MFDLTFTCTNQVILFSCET